MSGVVNKNGQQWEHCNQCNAWVKFQDLVYELPTEEHKHGRDLCDKCAGVESWLPSSTSPQPSSC